MENIMDDKCNILYIEDNVAYLKAYMSAFRRDFNFDHATNYNKALEKGKGDYDLIVSDYDLREGEDRTGVNLQKTFRSGHIKTPIVFATSEPDSVINKQKELGITEINPVLDKNDFASNVWIKTFKDEIQKFKDSQIDKGGIV